MLDVQQGRVTYPGCSAGLGYLRRMLSKVGLRMLAVQQSGVAHVLGVGEQRDIQQGGVTHVLGVGEQSDVQQGGVALLNAEVVLTWQEPVSVYLCTVERYSPCILNIIINNTHCNIIIYHDFLPAPRRASHVKSDKTHTQSLRYTP